MGTGKRVDRLLWAAGEAHRLRVERERGAIAVLSRSDLDMLVSEAFVTEWQPADCGAERG